jgi:GWxTD domain-containing protein
MKKKNEPLRSHLTNAQLGMKTFCLAGSIILLLQMLAACSAKGKAVSGLPLEDRNFLSEVRYIISKKESKMFKHTSPKDRPQFIEEFWKTRDPDPTTEENEFRDEYYRRIEEANHLFREGSSGWLSDRGRIYILLGEPERRDVYPTGYSFYEPPVEIWFYGNFPIIFIDSQREGIYKLDPTSARRISMINVAQMQLKPKGIERKVRLFEFSLSHQELGPGQAKLLMDIPYRVTNLVLNEKTKAYETQIKLTVRITGSEGKTALEKEELHPVIVSADMLEKLDKNFTIEFAFQLPPGSYVAHVAIENTTDRSQAQKEIKIKL